MSNPKWTEDQWEAITETGCNLLVSAAAGSGKTAVLVERIIKRITDESEGTDVDRLMVVTFTKAAAAEMRERISSAITKELNKCPESRHLNRQLTLLNRASITTLHSFCLEVLRQYFYRINLDPAFRVADDHEAALLRMETLEDLFEENYTAGSPEFEALVDSYGGNKDDVVLMDMVLKLYEFSSSNPWPEDWLRSLASAYRLPEGLPLQDTPWGREILIWLQLVLKGCRHKLEKARRLAYSPGGPEVYADNLAFDMAIIDDLINAARISWNEFYTVVNSVEFSKLKTCRNKDVDETLKERVKNIRDSVKKTVSTLRGDMFYRSPEDIAADLAEVAPLVESLAGLVIAFAEKYRQAKTERGLVDFADLEHYCLKILMENKCSQGEVIPSAVALELREYYEEVFVDEYQDINEVQETILKLVSRDETTTPNRFMVGDVKQSIYGFRLADPTLFMQKYESYPRKKGGPERGIDLRQNFRSRGEVLDAVNFIFRQVMTPRLGGLIYDDKAQLVCGASFPSVTDGISSAAGPVELHLLNKASREQEVEEGEETAENDELSDGDSEREIIQEDSENSDAIQREALLVAQRITEMVRGTGVPEFCVYDKRAAGYRPVQYRDIVVLLRTTRGTANVFVEEFRKLGVPAYADLGTGYFDALEVETVISILKIIDNPRQDIPLVAVLRSPIVGLNASELAEVRLRDRAGEFYDAVMQSAQLEDTTTNFKLKTFLAKLDNWRTLARQGSLSELIWRLYNETGYYSYVGGMPGGAQRQANLRALYDRARQYEVTAFKGLFRFLRFIEKFRESGSDLGAARALGENENVVRIISIHKSKGLEFPVVIAAGLGKQFNFSDLRQKVVLHKRLGIGLPVVDLDKCLTYQTVAQMAIKKRMLTDLLAEEMRVLYVALTRAKEKLILVGTVSQPEKTASRWCESISAGQDNLPDYTLAEAKTFLDWIGPALVRHANGNEIRKLGHCHIESRIPILEDVSCFKIYVHQSLDVLQPEDNAKSAGEDFIEQVRLRLPVELGEESGEPDGAEESLDRNLSWVYPHSEYIAKPAKASVTELKRRFAEGEQWEPSFKYRSLSPKRPAFLMRSTELSASEQGSAVHLVMQHVEFSSDLDEVKLREQLVKMKVQELLTQQQAQSIDVGVIMRFVKSSLGLRILDARELKREIPFTLAVPASRVYRDFMENCTEVVMVQGVIDCLIKEDDGFVLIDYKTDTAPVEIIVKKYREQLNLYAEAVEKIFKKPVKEKFLYLFHHGNEVKCD